jgi:hypothetical protein
MAVRDTSLEAFMDVKKNLSERQEAVYDAIVMYPDSTDQELTRFMGYWDPNKVRPRRRELVKAGLVYNSGVKWCPITGKKALVWRVT